MEGWIKLHRKILDSQYGKNPEVFSLFIHLLLMANHKKGYTADGTMLEPGQLMTSQVGLAKRLKLSRTKVQRLLLKLEDAKQIRQQTSSRNSIITVINWVVYQSDEHQAGSDRAPSGHQTGTNKNAKNNKNNTYTSGSDSGCAAEKNLPGDLPQDFRNPQELVSPGLFAVDSIHPLEEANCSDLARNVLTALNTICFRNFRPGKGNMKFVNARIKEGYTLEDFTAVFRHKQEQWGHDPKMSEFLRPQTLLSENFDSYLQAANASLAPMSEEQANEIIRQYFPGA